MKKLRLALPLALLMLGISACGGGTRLIKNAPPPAIPVNALATASDAALKSELAWVIVRDGPGAWAKNSDWDEYLIGVTNVSGAPVQVTGIVLFDSMDEANLALLKRSQLVAASRKNARRYQASGLKVSAGRGRGLALVAGGATASAAGLGVAMASVWGGAGSGTMAAASGLLLAGPALVTMAIVRGVRKGAVSERIVERGTVFPLTIQAGQSQPLDVFFPLAPAPRRIDIHYTDASGAHVLSTDTTITLAGLHL